MKEGFCDFKKLNFAYFDYAGTTFMPKNVIDKQLFYNRNIVVSSNRGKSVLSDIADNCYQNSRENIKKFFDDNDNYELIFYRSATNAFNEIIYGIENEINAMDIILLGPYEHHSNYIPWREIAKKKNAIVFEMPLLEDETINIEYLKEISDRIRIVAFSSIANTNGYRIELSYFESILKEDTIVIVDDSQKCGHEKIEQNSRIDCHIVNSHKMYGPKNLASALISNRLLSMLKPCIFGGGMVERIGFPNMWKQGTEAFESGTIDVANVIAWNEACDYIKNIGFESIKNEEKEYFEQVSNALKRNNNIKIISNKNTSSLISFYHKTIHAHDLGDFFSSKGIIVRTGNLCSQNSIMKYSMKPIVRISFGISTDEKDVNILLKAIEEII